jgi:hypothetical protein
MKVRVYRYIGNDLTRGQYGVRVSGGHTRLDDPSTVYVFDPDFGDLPFCSVDTAEQNGMVFEKYEDVEEDPPKF